MRCAFNNNTSIMEYIASQHDHDHEKTIHSGHFMISYVHEDADDPQIEEKEDLVINNNIVKHHYTDINNSGFQAIDGSIDSSLTGLFQQMTLAYSGKLVSPKWKNFRGIKVKLKEKIRLNNIIWREWFMQYIHKKKSVVCQFEIPAFEKTHCNPEAIVLEGKYWKRQLPCLTTEYKKWRQYYKDKMKKDTLELGDILERLCGPYDSTLNEMDSFQDQFWNDFLESDLPNFQDNMHFSSITPFAFPDPKEIVQEGFGKIVQPHLLQLQPTFVDQMEVDYLPFQEFSTKSFKHDPLINNQAPYSHDKLFESFEIDKIQRQLMNEVQIFKSSQPVPQLVSQNRANFQWNPTVETFDNPFLDQIHNPLNNVPSVENIFNSQHEPSVYDKTISNNIPELYLQHFRNTSQNLPDHFLLQNNIQFNNEPQFQPAITCNSNQLSSNSSSSPVLVEINQFRNQLPISVPTHQSFIIPTIPQVEKSIVSLHENLEAAKRRASTGSVVTSRNKDKKHVSFAVPNLPIQPMKQRTLNSVVQRVGDAPRLGVLKPAKPFQSSLLEQLLLQGKKKVHQSAALPPSSDQTKNKGRRFKKPVDNFMQGNNNNMVAIDNLKMRLSCTSTTNNIINTQHQHNPCFISQTAPDFRQQDPKIKLHQSISHPVQNPSANQQLQIFLVQDNSAPFSTNRPIIQSPSSDLITMTSVCDPNMNPMNVRFEMNNEMASQTIKFNNSLQNFNQFNQVNFQDSSHQNINSNNQLAFFPACIQEGTSTSSFVVDQPRPHTWNRSRHSSNDSSSGHGTSDSLKEKKKTYHMSAEHQRRCMIKQGFDTMNELVPELKSFGAGKINKASTLTKGAEYIKALRHDKDSVKELIRMCKGEVEQLNNIVSDLLQRLPASGICASSHKTDRMNVMMKQYIYERTMNNWKFWIFSTIMKSWMESYNETVVTHSRDDMVKSIIMWLEAKCSLPILREGVLSSLPHLCKVTSILDNPSKLPQEALTAAHLNHPRAP